MTLTILSVLVAVAFLASGAIKISMIPMAADTSRRLGIPPQTFRLIGALEVIFAIMTLLGIWVLWIGTVGSLVLTCIAAGAILAHSRVADQPKTFLPPAVLGVFSFILFLVHLYQ